MFKKILISVLPKFLIGMFNKIEKENVITDDVLPLCKKNKLLWNKKVWPVFCKACSNLFKDWAGEFDEATNWYDDMPITDD